ncbi:Oxidoreductase [Sphingomonas antarctica]|uniref:Gfo/Idh/MocA family protein n=1 Tax=Sphingomonas antarctica TaxID=2040274 RepID=UPI0039E8C2FD
MRVGILGCGGIAVRHANAAKAAGLEMVAACSRNMAKAQAFTAEHGGMPYDDLDRMIDAGLDLLVVTTPPFGRQGEAEQAASRGVNLLVEKPIALDIAAATRMADAAEASGVTAAIGFMYRHGSAVRDWKARDTGPVGLYAGAYHCNALHADWWRDEAQSGGQILEQVIHQIDLIRHLMGEPATVYARRANLFHGDTPGYSVEDVSAIVFGWDDGRIATLNASNIATPGVWHKEWNLFAQKLTGRFTSWNEAVFTPTTVGATPEPVTSPANPFVTQMEDVAAAIRRKRTPLIPLREGVTTLRLALAARQSADERREIDVR